MSRQSITGNRLFFQGSGETKFPVRQAAVLVVSILITLGQIAAASDHPLSNSDFRVMATGGMTLEEARKQMVTRLNDSVCKRPEVIGGILYGRCFGIGNGKLCAFWWCSTDSTVYLAEFDEQGKSSFCIRWQHGVAGRKEIEAFVDTGLVLVAFENVAAGPWTPPDLWITTNLTATDYLDPLELGPVAWRSINQSTGEEYCLLITNKVVKLEQARKEFLRQ